MKDIKKVLNNGEHTQDKRVHNFLTDKGYRTPQYIWIGLSNDDIEFCQMTKKGVVSAIERDNRLSKKGIFNV